MVFHYNVWLLELNFCMIEVFLDGLSCHILRFGLFLRRPTHIMSVFAKRRYQHSMLGCPAGKPQSLMIDIRVSVDVPKMSWGMS